MNLLDVVRDVRRHLEANGRVSTGMMRRQYDLDDNALAAVVEELVDVQRVARREDGALAFAAAMTPVSAPPPPDPRTYTPKHLADKILQSKSALAGERKQVTVLFADVKGSMELASQVDAEAWHEILERFFAILTEGVHRFEGTVNQYTGDGIMALFGAPIAHEDHARRACYAALHLQEQLRGYANELRLRRGLNFSARLGLNSGEVIVGKIGDDLRMDYTAQGQTVGLAARMEQIAEPGKVYVTAHTAVLVQGYFALIDLGAMEIKGVQGQLQVHELQGIGQLRTGLEVSRSRGLSRFVGRGDEMQVLEAALARARDSNAQIVGIVGEAGLGKSRLCFEFLERCRARGLMTYETTGVSHGKAIPFLPMLRLFRAFFGITEQDSDATARERIAGREFDEPTLAAVVGLDAPLLREALQKLESTEFIYAQSLYPVADYLFKHPLTQEVALTSQLHDKRRRLHAAVARVTESTHGDDVQAVHWHQRAAEWAGARDPVEGLRHWRRVAVGHERG